MAGYAEENVNVLALTDAKVEELRQYGFRVRGATYADVLRGNHRFFQQPPRCWQFRTALELSRLMLRYPELTYARTMVIYLRNSHHLDWHDPNKIWNVFADTDD